MGQPKGLVIVEGRAWIDRQIASFGAYGGRRVIVVLGRARDEYAAALAWIDDASASGAMLGDVSVTVAVNDDPDRGPFSSLQVGVHALKGDDASLGAAYVLPIDVPAPDESVWRALAAGADGADASVPVFDGRGGHPVLCSAALLDDILATSLDAPDARLDAKLRGRKSVRRVDVADARVLANFNRPTDWNAKLM